MSSQLVIISVVDSLSTNPVSGMYLLQILQSAGGVLVLILLLFYFLFVCLFCIFVFENLSSLLNVCVFMGLGLFIICFSHMWILLSSL